METTGLADPAPIVQLLLNNPLVSHFVRLDTVVTTVDAVNGVRQIDEHVEAVKQAALADRLLLTKADLAAADAIEQLRRRVVALNPGATWHTVSHGEIAPDVLFGAALFDPARKTVDVQRWINEAAYEAEDHDHANHDHDHKGHGHGTDISAYCLTVEQPLPWDAFHLWLGRVRSAVGEDLLRVKGILNLIDEPAPVVIHGVHHIFHPAGATRRLARRRPPVQDRIHHQRDRSRRPGSKLYRACRPTGRCLRQRALERDRPAGIVCREACSSNGRRDRREPRPGSAAAPNQDPRKPVSDPNDGSGA